MTGTYHLIPIFVSDQERREAQTPPTTFTLDFNNQKLRFADLPAKLRTIEGFKEIQISDSLTQSLTADEIAKIVSFSPKNPLSPTDQLTVEKYKLALITMVHEQLKPVLPEKKEQSTPSSELSFSEKIGAWLQKNTTQETKIFVFAFLMLIEFAPILVSGLMYANESLTTILPFIPFVVPGFILTSVGVAIVISSLIGTICFIAPIIMEWIGLTSLTQNESLFQIYKEQLSITKAINDTLTKNNTLEPQKYSEFIRIATPLNNNMVQLQNNNPGPKEGFLSKAINATMIICSILQSFSGSIFLSAAMIGWWKGSALLVPAFVATMPLTIALVSVPFFITAFAMAYRLRNVNAFNALHQDGVQHEKLQAKLKKFTPITETEFSNILSDKRILFSNAKTQDKKEARENTATRKPMVTLTSSTGYVAPPARQRSFSI